LKLKLFIYFLNSKFQHVMLPTD